MPTLDSIPRASPPPPGSAFQGRPSPVGLAADQRSFASVLARGHDGGAPRNGPGSAVRDERAAREAAEQLVAISLVQPVLKQLRDSDRAAPPFAPTQAERQFRSLMDAELAQRIVRASGFPLVERLARELLARGSAATTDGVRGNAQQDGSATIPRP